MQSKVPLYPYGVKEAHERGEIEKWRESFRENCACAGGIDILIRENFDGMHLKDGTVEKIVGLYGYKRTEYVLANTVQELHYDGRFHPDNRKWAGAHYIPEDDMHNACFAVRSHPAILDGFISHYRKLVICSKRAAWMPTWFLTSPARSCSMRMRRITMLCSSEQMKGTARATPICAARTASAKPFA